MIDAAWVLAKVGVLRQLQGLTTLVAFQVVVCAFARSEGCCSVVIDRLCAVSPDMPDGQIPGVVTTGAEAMGRIWAGFGPWMGRRQISARTGSDEFFCASAPLSAALHE